MSQRSGSLSATLPDPKLRSERIGNNDEFSGVIGKLHILADKLATAVMTIISIL